MLLESESGDKTKMILGLEAGNTGNKTKMLLGLECANTGNKTKLMQRLESGNTGNKANVTGIPYDRVVSGTGSCDATDPKYR